LAALAGACGGLAVANRSALALNLGLVALLFLLRRRPALGRLAALALGAVAVLGPILAYNTAAAGRFTAVGENGGQVFVQGHCSLAMIEAPLPGGGRLVFGAPPHLQRGGGLDVRFDTPFWDQAYYYQYGLDCIRENGLGHLRVLARSLLDMTVSTVIWPHVGDPVLAKVAAAANALYVLALPVIVVGGLRLARRRRGVGLLPAHQAPVLVVALVYFGDPRYRFVYDLFGLAVLAAVIADRYLDRSAAKRVPDPAAPPRVSVA
jgi:hypothetical protein